MKGASESSEINPESVRKSVKNEALELRGKLTKQFRSNCFISPLTPQLVQEDHFTVSYKNNFFNLIIYISIRLECAAFHQWKNSSLQSYVPRSPFKKSCS